MNMLLDSHFYKIIKIFQEGKTIKAEISFCPEHAIFGGHFPEQAIVPGVCMLQIIKEIFALSQQLYLDSLVLNKASQIKFLQLITPEVNQIVEVQIDWKSQEQGEYNIQSVLKKNNIIAMKLSGLLSQSNIK